MPTNPAAAYGISRIAAPFVAAESTTQPTAQTEPRQDWLESIGRAAKRIGTQAAAELQQMAGQGSPSVTQAIPGVTQAIPGSEVPIVEGPARPGAVPYPSPPAPRGGPGPASAKPGFASGAAPMPSPRRPGPPQMAGVQAGPTVDLDPATAARGLVKRSPTLQRATADPAGTIEEATGRSVDDIVQEIRETTDVEIPDDLTRQEKGQLMLEMGLRIMSGGPGLIQAVGNAGLHTMGTYAQMQQRKREEAQAQQEAEREMLGTELDVALSREERGAETALAREKMASRERMARQRAQRPYSDIGKLREDLRAGRITEQDFERALTEGAGGDEGTAFMRDTRFIARTKGIPLEEAVDIKLLSASARSNPEAFEREVYLRLVNKLGMNHEEALEQARAAREAFEQDSEALEVEPRDETQQAAGEGDGPGFSLRGIADEAIAAAREAFGGKPEATAEASEGVPDLPDQAPDELPADPAALVPGRIYRRNGKLYRYDPEADPAAPFEEVAG